ncbi:hypothetical protein IJJ39_01710 [Candidatus Saccharibacteria bacterium]|nr:hypothetical protein [Candidatus Saccharibacteria bacterium]
MKTVSLEELDKKNCFLHYTPKKNLPSIEKEGLLPKIGPNSKYIERTEKIFFCVGTEGFLTIMDVWLKWLAVQTNMPKWFYRFGCWWLRNKYTPKIFSTIYIKSFQSMPITKRNSRKVLKKILNESLILVLNLEEGKDFSYEDIDEAKDAYEINSAIKFMYPDKERARDDKIEYWNMHTFLHILPIHAIIILWNGLKSPISSSSQRSRSLAFSRFLVSINGLLANLFKKSTRISELSSLLSS